MTPVTLYMTNSPATVPSTSNKLVAITGGGLTNKNTTIGKATQYGEICSQGTTNAWPASSTLYDPDGFGYLWDVSVLGDNGASFLAGTWTATLRLNTNASSITANVHVRVYRRTANNTFNTIVLMVLNSQTINSTETNFTLSNTTTATSATFQSGDQIYADILLQITTNNTNSNTTLIKTNVANSSTLGNVNAQIVTPGYSYPTASSGDAAIRFRMSQNKVRDGAIRFRTIQARVYHDAAIRFRTVSAPHAGARDGAIRFRVISLTSHRDAAIRFRISQYPHSALFPTATRRAGLFPTTKRRESI